MAGRTYISLHANQVWYERSKGGFTSPWILNKFHKYTFRPYHVYGKEMFAQPKMMAV